MDEPATTDVIRAALAAGESAGGSQAALDRLYERCTPRLLSYIRLKLGRGLRERLESRDILQATLLKSFQRLDQFRGRDGRSLMAWLAKIAEREIADRADYHRRQRRDAGRESPLDEAGEPSVSPELTAHVRSVLSQVILNQRLEQLEKAIDSLSEAHREIILLRKFEDLSFAEISSRLGKSEDACRMLLARALTSLTLKLGGPERP